MSNLLEKNLRAARPVPPDPRPGVADSAFVLATAALPAPSADSRNGLARLRVSPRVAVALAALVLVAAIGATALASSNSWWFFGNAGIRPISQPVVVASSSSEIPGPFGALSGNPGLGSGGQLTGASQGVPWQFVSFTARHQSEATVLCYGVTPNPPNPRGRGAAINCGSTEYPGPGHSRDPMTDTHWLGYLTQAPGSGEAGTVKYVSGATAPNVASVDLIVSDGPPISVRTLAPPSGFPVAVRFYVAVLPVENVVRALVPRDASGHELERWNLPIGQ